MTTLPVKIEGHINAKLITSDGNELTVYNGHNDLTSDWDNILRRALAGQNNAHITKIGAYKNGALLAEADITQFNYPTGVSNEIEFVAVFSETSFDDTLDEIRLTAPLASFSSKTGLSIQKDQTAKLSIDWKLTINLDNT